MRYPYLETLSLFPVLVGMTAPAQATPAPELQAQVAQSREQDGAILPIAPCMDRPWYCGVSEDRQQRAVALYEEGNQLFDDSLFISAVDKYRAALAHWDHPSIHYNLMLALIALERPIEAYESSIAALRYGQGPLAPEEHEQARNYHKLLRGRVAVLEVRCDEPGATVSLDGKPLFRGPGTVRRFVLPGPHELVAKKPGYLTSHQTLTLQSEEPVQVQVALLPEAQAMITTRRWQRWQPWAVVGAGVGLGLLGGAFEWRANVNNRELQDLFDKECAPSGGCPPSSYSEALASRQRRYTWYRRLGHGAAVAGAATTVAGLVLAYFNRPLQMENPARRRLFRILVAPDLLGKAAAVTVQLGF